MCRHNLTLPHTCDEQVRAVKGYDDTFLTDDCLGFRYRFARTTQAKFVRKHRENSRNTPLYKDRGLLEKCTKIRKYKVLGHSKSDNKGNEIVLDVNVRQSKILRRFQNNLPI